MVLRGQVQGFSRLFGWNCRECGKHVCGGPNGRQVSVANLTLYIICVTLNIESETLWLTESNSHTNHSNTYGKAKGTFPESWTPCSENRVYLGSIYVAFLGCPGIGPNFGVQMVLFD